MRRLFVSVMLSALTPIFGGVPEVHSATQNEVKESPFNKDAQPPEEIPLPEIRWQGPIGWLPDKQAIMFHLMGNGYVLRPTSDDFDKLVREWLAKHPGAHAIPVATIQPMLVDFPESKSVYVWLVDGDDSLNLHLVRAGACEAGTMGPAGAVHVDAAVLKEFRDRAYQAELKAKEEGLGIWQRD